MADSTFAATSADLAYEVLLRASGAAPEEVRLQAAYDFGRDLLASGLGVLDLAAIHRRVLGRLLAELPSDEGAALVDRANAMLLESLAPFEMTHRGFSEAHTALAASEERHRDLIEHASDVIFTADVEGRVTSLNRAGQILTGYSADEAVGLALQDLLASGHGRVRDALRQLGRGAPERRRRHEVEIVARDGRRIPLEVSLRVVTHEGRPAGIQGIARDVTDRRRAQSALRHLNQLLELKIQHIAHALHDEAGQLLASVYLRVAEIASDYPPNGPERRRLDDLCGLLDQVDEQLRRLAHELRPTILDDLGLIPACQFLAEGVARRNGFAVTIAGSDVGRLETEIETVLYRVVQEALTNAAKHGRPQAVSVQFERQGALLHGRIQDDGVGFDVAKVISRGQKQGLGLIGMRERLIAVGGTLTIDSAPGRGTAIVFAVPVEQAHGDLGDSGG